LIYAKSRKPDRNDVAVDHPQATGSRALATASLFVWRRMLTEGYQ